MKTKKISKSKAYFKRFCDSFTEWQLKLGLTQYEIRFHHHCEKGYFAQIKVQEIAKLADVYLTTKLEGLDVECDDGPEAHAKHEALHLSLHRLLWLGESRYIERTDLDEEWEALVRRLEKVL